MSAPTTNYLPNANTQSNIATGLSINPSTGGLVNSNPTPATTASLLLGPLGGATPATPTTPVTKQVFTDAAGNSVATTHAPATGNAQTGGAGYVENPAYNFYNPSSNAAGVTPYISSSPVTPAPTSSTVSTGSIASGAPGSSTNLGPNAQAATASGNPIPTTPAITSTPVTPTPSNNTVPTTSPITPTTPSAVTGLLNSGQTVPAAVTAAQQAEIATQAQIGQLQQSATSLENQYNTSGSLLPISQGLSQNVASAEGGLMTGLQSTLAGEQMAAGQAQTQQTNQAGILNQAGQLQNTLVQSPYGTPLVNPATGTTYSGGQTVAPGTSTGGAISTTDPAYAALQQYATQVANGNMNVQNLPAPFNNAVVQAQVQQMATAINPNYNPSSTYTSEQGIIAQNTAQEAQYQGDSQQVSNAVQILPQVSNLITPYMSANALNSENKPIANQIINTINQQTDPVAYNTMQAATSEISTFAQSILQAGGMTPTDAQTLAASYTADLGSMTPTQLNTFVQNLGVIGQYRLSQYQSDISAAISANQQPGMIAPAQGVTATIGGALGNSGQDWFNGLPDGAKLIVGALLGVGGSAVSAVTGQAGNAVAGAVGGEAVNAVTGAGAATTGATSGITAAAAGL